jgi:hypothetical protein
MEELRDLQITQIIAHLTTTLDPSDGEEIPSES